MKIFIIIIILIITSQMIMNEVKNEVKLDKQGLFDYYKSKQLTKFNMEHSEQEFNTCG